MRSGPTERKPSPVARARRSPARYPTIGSPAPKRATCSDRTRDSERFFAVLDEEVGEPDGIRGAISRATRDDGVAAIASEQRDRRVQPAGSGRRQGFRWAIHSFARQPPIVRADRSSSLAARRCRRHLERVHRRRHARSTRPRRVVGNRGARDRERRSCPSPTIARAGRLRGPSAERSGLPAQMVRRSRRSSSTAAALSREIHMPSVISPVSPCDRKIAWYQSTLFDAQMIDSSFIPCSRCLRWSSTTDFEPGLRVVWRHGETGS